ncbi:MAG: glycosyltransferase [Firmicutes bacterium]|nr:glycosyltransferase [Bacillota bacterium]
MPSVNMRSSATSVKAQGPGSCYLELVWLVSGGLKGKYRIYENSRRRCDIAHYHTVNPNYYLERLLLRRVQAGICYVHFLPDTVDESLRMPKLFRKVFYRYLLAFYNSMDYLVVVNPAVLGKLAGYGVTRPKPVYIPNFVSDRGFSPLGPEKRAEARAELGYSKEDFVVMGAGQTQTRKGIADFVKTAERLPCVKFMWAGGFSFGKMTDGYEEISKLMRNPPPNVRFLGIVEREKMAGLYNAADMFFLPSYDELFPVVILEAAACGKPILLRGLELYRGILFDYYISGNSVGDFAELIEKTRADAGFREALERKALECHAAYSEGAILDMWERLYGEACELERRRRGVTVMKGNTTQ